MKTILLLLCLSITACADTNYLRKISNAVVNLKPLYDWDDLRGTIGDKAKNLPARPLTSWSKLHLIIFDKDTAGWLARSSLPNKQSELVLVRNLPPPGAGEWPRGASTTIYAMKTGVAKVKNITVPVYDHGKVVQR